MEIPAHDEDGHSREQVLVFPESVAAYNSDSDGVEDGDGEEEDSNRAYRTGNWRNFTALDEEEKRAREARKQKRLATKKMSQVGQAAN